MNDEENLSFDADQDLEISSLDEPEFEGPEFEDLSSKT